MNASEIRQYLTEEEWLAVTFMPFGKNERQIIDCDKIVAESLAASRKREREMREILNRYEEESAAAYNQDQDFGCLKEAMEKITALLASSGEHTEGREEEK